MAVVLVLMLKQNWFLFSSIYQALLQLRALNKVMIYLIKSKVKEKAMT